jgi:two-component system cell cycle sensor histidine kinase/response regulator CckA
MLWLYLTALLPVALLLFLALYDSIVAALPRHPFTAVGKTILLVDDDPKVGKATGRNLKLRGFAVLLAADGETAVKIVKSYPHHIDLLITDIIMPGMSGPLLVEQVLAVRPLTPILFISGLADQNSLPQRIEERMAFLEKPFSAETLTQEVRHLLQPKAWAA